MSNEHNGLLTKVWGPDMWKALHSIAFGYPLTPSEDQKMQYKQFFTSLGHVLPCIYCRISYNEFITGTSQDGEKIKDYDARLFIDDSIFESRETLTKWLYYIHERVNKKLDVDYKVSYEDVVVRYESFRAICSPDKKGCIMPLDKKAQSYVIADVIECPVIPAYLARKFVPYAKERGISKRYTYIMDIYDDDSLDKLVTNRMTERWYKRNKNCRKIISHMRKKGIPLIEHEGAYMGLPSVYELKLIMMLSSNICLKKLEEISKSVVGVGGLSVECPEDH